MTDLQLQQIRAGSRVRSRETARVGTVMQRWVAGPLVPNFTHINVQMDDGTAVRLDSTGSILSNLDFLAGGYTNECENCAAQSMFLTYLSLDIEAEQAAYTCSNCGHNGTCRVVGI
jgi:hypothetical protein